MPAGKNNALQANDVAFQSSFQDIFKNLQTRLATANSAGDIQASIDAATNGLKMLKDVNDKMETIIGKVFP
jgi:hypothetical protein